MPTLPKSVLSAWQERTVPAVLTTVSDTGVPNAIFTAFVSQYSDDAFVITDHYFCKTRDNILGGSKGSLLFLSPDGKSSYQIKGTFQYHRDDEVFEQIKNSMPPNLPSRAAVILKIDSVYSGSEKLC